MQYISAISKDIYNIWQADSTDSVEIRHVKVIHHSCIVKSDLGHMYDKLKKILEKSWDNLKIFDTENSDQNSDSVLRKLSVEPQGNVVKGWWLNYIF